MSWNFSLTSDFNKANSVKLSDIFNYFNLNIKPNNNCSCPFHTDRSPSFRYYEDTNTYHCFSCNSGGSSVSFVSNYENISKNDASIFILNNFAPGNIVTRSINNEVNSIKYCIEFSHLIRNFVTKNKNNSEALQYADDVCVAFDNIRDKYNLDDKAMNGLVTKLKNKISNFQ